jgi:3-methyl-2-oxobutanoate hydroxymethyltransferase
VPITVRDVRAFKERGERFAMLTAYDAAQARLLDEAGIPLLLVGDTLGMAVLGYADTVPVTMDEMLHHTAAVARGARDALVIGDMPFMSYQAAVEDGIRNAGRFLKEAGANAVKLEGGASVVELVRRLTAAGIPVMGHVGLTPQSILALGSFKAQGRDRADWPANLEDAEAVAEAGAFSVVVEAVAEPLGRAITESVSIPTIGIGASPACDGQILVLEDMLGLTPRAPKFVKRYGDIGPSIAKAVEDYAREVRERTFPAAEHTYAERKAAT